MIYTWHDSDGTEWTTQPNDEEAPVLENPLSFRPVVCVILFCVAFAMFVFLR